MAWLLMCQIEAYALVYAGDRALRQLLSFKAFRAGCPFKSPSRYGSEIPGKPLNSGFPGFFFLLKSWLQMTTLLDRALKRHDFCQRIASQLSFCRIIGMVHILGWVEQDTFHTKSIHLSIFYKRDFELGIVCKPVCRGKSIAATPFFKTFWAGCPFRSLCTLFFVLAVGYRRQDWV